MGFFIVFEGGEGSGKSLQKQMLKSALEKKGFSVFLSREPGGLDVCEEIRNILQNPVFKDKLSARTEMFLFMASRALHTEKVILEKINKVDFFISDRYSLSSVAYQGYGRGLLDEVNLCNKIATAGLVPDLTFILNVSAKKGLNKVAIDEFGKKDRFEQESLSFHEKVNQGYLKEAESNPGKIKVIDYIDGSPEKMHEKILNCIIELTKEKSE